MYVCNSCFAHLFHLLCRGAPSTKIDAYVDVRMVLFRIRLDRTSRMCSVCMYEVCAQASNRISWITGTSNSCLVIIGVVGYGLGVVWRHAEIYLDMSTENVLRRVEYFNMLVQSGICEELVVAGYCVHTYMHKTIPISPAPPFPIPSHSLPPVHQQQHGFRGRTASAAINQPHLAWHGMSFQFGED